MWSFGAVGYGGLFGVEVAVVFSGVLRLADFTEDDVRVGFCGFVFLSDMEAGMMRHVKLFFFVLEDRSTYMWWF